MGLIDQTKEPLLGPDRVQTSALSMRRDGLTIELVLVARDAAMADAIYEAFEAALSAPAFRVADLSFRLPP